MQLGSNVKAKRMCNDDVQYTGEIIVIVMVICSNNNSNRDNNDTLDAGVDVMYATLLRQGVVKQHKNSRLSIEETITLWTTVDMLEEALTV